jgi:hypothetical protein
MIRILFLVLWIMPFLFSQAQGALEIYVDGHKYDSFQAYLASKKAAVIKNPATPVTLNNQEEDDIRKEAKQWGMDVDFSKVKTFQVGQKDMPDKTLHQFYVLSVEHGVVGALQDFYQNWGQSEVQVPRTISSEQLQVAIQQAVATSKEPKLLISEPGKVRIMAMSPDNTKQ